MSAATKISTKMPAAVASAHLAAAEALAAGAPKSVLSIPTCVRYGPIPLSDLADPRTGRVPGAAIRQIGSTRRIFLLDPYLNREEMEGLAHRIRILSKNTHISSMILANNVEVDDVDATLPTSLLQLEKEAGVGHFNMIVEGDASAGEGNIFYAAGGYDARAIGKSPKDNKRKTLNALMRLTKAVKGGANNTNNANNNSGTEASKIPMISVPHGLVTDGGYATSMGSYVLATTDSRFRIMNPLRGLSLDPVGFSYVLPRLGWEFNQPSANYPVGSILALTGYEADGGDMVETGLATHYMGSFGKMADLERALSEFDPYGQQTLIKEQITRQGADNTRRSGGRDGGRGRNMDVNARFRNVAVARLLFNTAEYDAMGQDFVSPADELEFLREEDPSLVFEADGAQFLGDRKSMLLNIAATFQDIFEKEKSVVGIMERMSQHASASANNAEEEEFVHAAKNILEGMKAQSPLALTVTHKLLTVGREQKETLESCMEREKKVQMKLFEKQDFKKWVESGAKEGEFKDWMHKSVKDVTSDEVEELLR